jgi:hypothetical protein
MGVWFGEDQRVRIINALVCLKEGRLRFKTLRAGSDYGQTLRGEAFGSMKMHKCPKSVLSSFTLEAEVQRTSPPKEPRWQHF